MKITKKQLRRIVRESLSTEVPELTGGRKPSWQAIKEKELAKRRASKLQVLFQKFDDIENRMSKMGYSHPEFEAANDEYDEIEEELEILGYEIVGTFNPFKVSGGKIRDKSTGKIVHKRQKR